MKFNRHSFFSNIMYVGEYESVRQIYYIYRKGSDYMLVTLSRRKLDSFNVSFISRECIEYITANYADMTINRLSIEKQGARIFGEGAERSFKILSSLYVLCVLGRASKVERDGRASWFYIKNEKK